MRDTIDWKNKYLELRRRFASSLDLAFRQGYEKGATDTQVSDMQQQMAQNAQMMRSGHDREIVKSTRKVTLMNLLIHLLEMASEQLAIK